MKNQELRKITVSAEICRKPRQQDKGEQELPNNSLVFCGRAFTYVYAVTYAEAIELAKKKFDEHFKGTEYTADTYGALNCDKEDEKRKEYQTFIE